MENSVNNSINNTVQSINSDPTDNYLVKLDLAQWSALPQDPSSQSVLSALEQGKLLFLPQLKFALTADELTLLDPAVVDPKRKNISLQPLSGKINGVADPAKEAAVKALIERFYQSTQALISGLLPYYKHSLHSPTTSLRLHPVTKWTANASWRKDDSRLHVDAFPSRPNHGERIIRIFTNINPHNESRLWRVGESFPSLAEHFLPTLAPYSPFKAKVMSMFGITKGYRSHYDHLMLQLHDRMKESADYQNNGEQLNVAFPAGSSWICFSDQTPHAAMGGQFMLEQTYLLPVEAMVEPQHAPLNVLQKMLKRPLI